MNERFTPWSEKNTDRFGATFDPFHETRELVRIIAQLFA
jgi:hypothetical protein